MANRPPHVSAAASQRSRTHSYIVLSLLTGLAIAGPAAAQLRPVAIEGATILSGTGLTVPQGTVTFQGGKITAVGKDIPSSLLTRKIAARGKFVTPGFIDASSTLALRLQLVGGMPTALACDAFDRYAQDEIRSAWRDGITTIYLPARAASGIGGYGSVIRLAATDDPNELVLRGKATLCATIAAAGPQGTIARVKATEDLRRRFRAARDYRDAWNGYEESVKEYETKLAERNKKEPSTKPAAAEDAAKKEGPPPEPKKPEPTEKKDEKKEELKKPDEPGKDRGAEVLLRVIDGELRLQVEAHDPADILNALDLAEEFNLAIILEGATGAHLVADRLAKMNVPVVLTAPPAPVAFVAGPARYERPNTAALLRKAGVDVYFGTGVLPNPETAPHLPLTVARAVGYGFGADAALTAMTAGAARLLGVEKEIGRIEAGLQADLVVWSDHPFAPGAQVERVFVAGHEVYRAGQEHQEPEE